MNLEALKKGVATSSSVAQDHIARCQSEIQTLVNLAKQVPEKVFDRYSHVLVSSIELYNEDPFFSGYISVNNCQTQLRGLMGGANVKKGSYRVIVLLEPLS